ncbi:putative Multi-domain non-ribosomal peptide synthetase [Nitrospira japonica]|uniref:Putative Multi-domain non-ribosomal peptide synthetase n=1 Tax=Nitrospira japonica TaxID=1325564 RepID=A0A1W1I8A5_9BACT|nr:putative Multi-domain non-ribosomal peptide synthetase [Nitrospira japonica]
MLMQVPSSIHRLDELFFWRCGREPQATAYTYLRDDLELGGQYTYEQLAGLVRRLAAQLERQAEPGARVLLLFSPGLDMVCAFWASILAGLIPVPAPPPDPLRTKNSLPALLAIVEDASVSLVITTSAGRATLADASNGVGIALSNVISLDQLYESPVSEIRRQTPQTEKNLSIAYLQYTSGSTTGPRGVMISHDNVLAQCHGLTLSAAVGSESRSLCWLPYYHDYGLVHGIIAPFYAGIPAFLMSPVTFLRRPLRWLEAISRWNISHSGAPNFAYEACVQARAKQSDKRSDWHAELSGWTVASCGAEPIRPSTIDRFCETFAPHGFKRTALMPAYGLAEATLVVTSARTDEPPLILSLASDQLERHLVEVRAGHGHGIRTLVGCGRPLPGVRIRIVDPTYLVDRMPGEVGEIWVSGPSVSEGYWNRTELNETTFSSAEEDRTSRYLRTGDLGFQHDGQLFIAGRLKDLIILNGRNLYPQDLEQVAEACHTGLRQGGCAAFTVEGERTEQLVIVQEIERIRDLDTEAVAMSVRTAIAQHCGAPVHDVVFVRSGAIPRTSSGKIQRRACRSAYLNNTIAVVASCKATDASDLPGETEVLPLPFADDNREAALVRAFADCAGIVSGQVSLDKPIVSYGLDSLKVTMLKHRLESDFGIDVTFAQLFGSCTLGDLARMDAGHAVSSHQESEESGSIAAVLRSSRMDGSGDADPARPRSLSPGQRRLWFIEQIHPGSALNHIVLAVRLRGALDHGRLQDSLTEVVRRHPLLRAFYSVAAGAVQEHILAEAEVRMRRASMADLPTASVDDEVRRWIKEETLVPFDLGTPPLLRALLLDRGLDDHVLVLTIHRLIADGWSLRVLMKEMGTIYDAADGALRLPPSSDQGYRDYVEIQLQGTASEWPLQLDYWTRLLAHYPPALRVPTDRTRPRVRRYLGGARYRALDPSLLEAIESFCRQEAVTKFMLLYAAFAVWLQRCTRTDDIALGTVVANRRLSGVEQAIGYFANTVVLRLDLTDVRTVRDLLTRSRNVVAGAYDHQDVPFERVIEALNAQGDGTPAVPFNVMIVWEDDPLTDLALRDMKASHLPIDDFAVEFDLTLLILNRKDRLELVLLYDKDIFDGSTVDRMLDQVVMLLQAMVAHPAMHVAALPLLAEGERRMVLETWNETEAELACDATIPDLLTFQARTSPDYPAVVCGEGRLSYRDLDIQSTVLARAICRVTQGDPARVGLCVERSVSSLVGLFGILKAGAAYVPVDPGAPEQRQRMVLEDADVSLVVTQRHLRMQLPFADDTIIELEELQQAAASSASTISLPTIRPDRLAYIIYTSGSTGRPKGVEVTHGALQHSLAARLHYYGSRAERCLLTFPLAFDGSITSIFWSVLCGGTLIVPSEDSARDTDQLAALIARHAVTHVVLIPSLYEVLLCQSQPSALRTLQTVVVAGESVFPDVVHRHYERLPDVSLYNEYGPTEATVWTTVYKTNGTENGVRVPIGKPIANATVYLLNSSMQPVPVGMIGELYIGGAGLAHGYHNQPETTRERFMDNPFRPGTRLYRTGDLGVFRRDGNIEFIGREDEQVKIRGYRVELGEIEANARALPGIRDAVAVVQSASAVGPTLVAFVTVDQQPAPAGAYLLDLLRRKMPSYMVPTAVEVLDALPLLPNGKIDRKALQQWTRAPQPAGAPSPRPRDQIEYSLIELWSDILARSAPDVHESFFALGGHSLLASQVVSRVREVFRVELPIRALFDDPTIAGLADRIRAEQSRANARPPLPPITPVSRAKPLPLSYSQQRMWFIQQLAPEATAYNLLFVSRQRGALKVPILRQVVDLLSRRHEAFRTTFAMTGTGPVQRIAPWQSPHLVEIDLRRLPKELRETEARRIAQEEGRRPFDLERGPLARISVVKLEQDDHLLILNLHHIVGDQWSFGILGRDFASYYNALSQDLPLPEMPLAVQYADYAAWQRRCLTAEVLEDQEGYWKKTLADLSTLNMPTDYPRPSMQTFRGAYCSIDIPDSMIETLKQFGARHRVTSFMTMLACFQLLLSRYSGQTDVAVGSPIANRTQMAMEQLIGTFVNTLVIRLNLGGDPPFVDLVERVKEASLGAFTHQDYPFDRLVDTLQTARDPSMAPLIQVLFNMVNAPIGDIQLYGLKWEPFEVDPGSAQFDLSLTVELEVAKKAYLTFNTDLFKRETAVRLLQHFLSLLQDAVERPAARISELSMLGKAERMQLLVDWNRTVSPYPHTQCFPELFEARVQRAPNATAVSMEGASLSYHDLNAKANRLARLLVHAGVRPGTIVGLCLDRSIEMVAALLAIMKAGGCYVPLDPDFPRDRLRFMVEDSEAPFVLTTSVLAERFAGQNCRQIRLDRETAALRQGPDDNPAPVATARDLAYVLYTSGSTGHPKGVRIRHGSLTNFLWAMKDQPGCVSRDVMLSVTTLSFDIAALELYLPLLVGARVELVSRAVAMDGWRLARTLEAVQPTIMQATPATWRLLLESGWSGSSSLTALCGGEALPPDLASLLLKRVKVLWNMYGPTETTVWSTMDRVMPEEPEITIGRPIANTEVYVLDAHLQPVPVGVPGELFIGGAGLAQGYHRRTDLTGDRFIRHPFSNDLEARIYRTGDLVRYREDGRLIHMGRLDTQVKVRGFRIELEEIQSVLSRHPKIRQAVVTARPDRQGIKQLAAYVVAADGAAPVADELRAYARAFMPEYMVPSYFVLLDKLPLTANNKIDVRALPEPEVSGHAGGAARIAPRNGMELQLTALWQQVLGVQEIGIHDNFFDLGGHSFKAAQLFFQLEAVFGRQLPLATLFQAPTVADLAAVLTQANWTPPWQSLVAIQAEGVSTPLFMVPGVGGNVLVFAKLAKLLGADQPIYGLQARGLDGMEAPFTSVPDMATHYVQAMKQVHPQGPFLIAGVCTGGLIAYEMARQLRAEKKDVTIFMLDTWHPDSYTSHRRRLLNPVFMGAVVMGKIWSDLMGIVGLPLGEWWPTTKRKALVLKSLIDQSVTDHIMDQDFQVQRLTKATLVAVSRYRVEPMDGDIVNVVASRNTVREGVADTRHDWQDLGSHGSSRIYLQAENSGRMFVSPYVEELANHMQRRFWNKAVSPIHLLSDTAFPIDPLGHGGRRGALGSVQCGRAGLDQPGAPAPSRRRRDPGGRLRRRRHRQAADPNRLAIDADPIFPRHDAGDLAHAVRQNLEGAVPPDRGAGTVEYSGHSQRRREHAGVVDSMFAESGDEWRHRRGMRALSCLAFPADVSPRRHRHVAGCMGLPMAAYDGLRDDLFVPRGAFAALPAISLVDRRDQRADDASPAPEGVSRRRAVRGGQSLSGQQHRGVPAIHVRRSLVAIGVLRHDRRHPLRLSPALLTVLRIVDRLRGRAAVHDGADLGHYRRLADVGKGTGRLRQYSETRRLARRMGQDGRRRCGRGAADGSRRRTEGGRLHICERRQERA